MRTIATDVDCCCHRVVDGGDHELSVVIAVEMSRCMLQTWATGLSAQKRRLQVVGRPVLVRRRTRCPPALGLALLLCHCRGHHDAARSAHEQKQIFPC